LPIIISDMKTVTDMSSMGALSALSIVCFGLVRLQANPQNELKPTVKIPYLSAKLGLFPLLLVALFVQQKYFLSFTELLSNIANLPIVFWWIAFFGMCYYSLKKEFSFIPAMGCLSALLVLSLLGLHNWIMFGGWLAIGLAIYIFYGSRNSYLKQK
jgi:APA family basic amino acid/polyamine antiporter